jgi:hypothetical protein
MHQQVRTTTTRKEGPGADTARSGLVELLEVLEKAGVNMQAAGGSELDGGGEFVFSVHHGDEDPDGPTQDAIAALEKASYEPYVAEPHVCEVNDEPGELLRCIRKIRDKGAQIAEIHVGTAEGGRVPVQVVTREQFDAARSGRRGRGGYTAS